MPQFRTTRRVKHSADDMFALVADIERYPQFVPLCQSLIVRRRITDDQGREVVTAAMTIAYKMIRETFTSRVTLDKEKRTITVAYVDGPFSRMNNTWTFTPTDERSCEVAFAIDYEFRSRTLGMIMGAVFDRVFRTFSEAFENRADKVYGKQVPQA
ncbi:MAG: type II toxin-antitoxin system RatA family toxin [Rhizobiales bacterium]|nr:type II toxin-antitoxin system RatA family toxin [Hyphomicrobiales bacterium]